MKFAIVTAVKAFLAQSRENVVELAKKTCEKSGYSVVKSKKDNNIK